MSGGRRLLLALLGLALLGAGLWTLPPLLDWNAQRPRLAVLASERLGRPVMLEGPVAFALLPQPRFEASRIRVAPGADGIGGEARALRLRLDLAALLLGRVEVREVALVGAEIRLPWPPAALPGFAPPPWLASLDARIEESRVLIGEAAVEGVTARVTAGGLAEAVRASGSFRWRNAPVAFEAVLGRAGDDGVAPIDLSARLAGAAAQARGSLLAEGGFEGRFDAEGPDLAALIPAPPGPFRARGTLRAGAELVAADALALEWGGGQFARGAASLRLAPEARADVTLAAQRLDLAPWLAALRAAGPQTVPLSLDLSAEVAELGALRLRRLRGAAWLEGEKLTLSDVAADLPGGAQAELSGTGAGPRLDMALRLRAARPRELAASLGLPPGLPVPAEAAEGTARLSWQGSSLAATDIAASFGANRVRGGATWRNGARPALALGLEMDALDAGEGGDALAALRGAAERVDLSLRLGVARLLVAGTEWRRVALDGAAEGGRAVIRSLAAERGGAEFQAAGTVALAQPARLSDAVLDLRGSAGAVLAPLGIAAPARAALLPLRARAQAQGPLDALALRIEAESGDDARLEAQGTLNAPQRRGQGNVTLRHPGAARLLDAWGLAAPWVGPGSLSVIAALSGQPGQWQAENLEIVAGEARLRAQGALSWNGARPRLTGRVAAESLPLPAPRALALPPLDAELSLSAQSVALAGLPPLEQASAELRLEGGALRLEGLRARLSGGAVEGALAVEPGPPPVLAVELRLSEVVVAGPLTGHALDLTAGRVTGEARLRAEGHSAAALAATLGGEVRGELRGGVLAGLDLPAAAAALSLREPAEAEAALRRAFAGGATAFEALSARLAVEAGEARVEEGRISAEGGVPATVSGRVDLARGALDLRFALRGPEGPEAALRLLGPAAAPRRQEEIGAFLRWLAER